MDWTPPPPLACSLTPIHAPTPEWRLNLTARLVVGLATCLLPKSEPNLPRVRRPLGQAVAAKSLGGIRIAWLDRIPGRRPAQGADARVGRQSNYGRVVRQACSAAGATATRYKVIFCWIICSTYEIVNAVGPELDDLIAQAADRFRAQGRDRNLLRARAAVSYTLTMAGNSIATVVPAAIYVCSGLKSGLGTEAGPQKAPDAGSTGPGTPEDMCRLVERRS